jgi:hypothetical protein
VILFLQLHLVIGFLLHDFSLMLLLQFPNVLIEVLKFIFLLSFKLLVSGNL